MSFEILTVGKVFVPYVWVVNDNGLITQAKFKQEIDLNTIKIGDSIKSFYGEKFKLYNVAGTEYSLTPNGPISSDNIGKKDKIKNLVSQLVGEMKNVEIEDLHLAGREEKSMYENIVDNLNKYSLSVTDSTNFDLDRYIAIRNELVYEKSFLTPLDAKPYSELVRIFDGFLSSNGIIEGIDGVELMKEVTDDINEGDEGEYMVHYSDICSAFRKFEDFAHLMKSEDRAQLKFK